MFSKAAGSSKRHFYSLWTEDDSDILTSVAVGCVGSPSGLMHARMSLHMQKHTLYS